MSINIGETKGLHHTVTTLSTAEHVVSCLVWAIFLSSSYQESRTTYLICIELQTSQSWDTEQFVDIHKKIFLCLKCVCADLILFNAETENYHLCTELYY